MLTKYAMYCDRLVCHSHPNTNNVPASKIIIHCLTLVERLQRWPNIIQATLRSRVCIVLWQIDLPYSPNTYHLFSFVSKWQVMNWYYHRLCHVNNTSFKKYPSPKHIVRERSSQLVLIIWPRSNYVAALTSRFITNIFELYLFTRQRKWYVDP